VLCYLQPATSVVQERLVPELLKGESPKEDPPFRSGLGEEAAPEYWSPGPLPIRHLRGYIRWLAHAASWRLRLEIDRRNSVNGSPLGTTAGRPAKKEVETVEP